jgi:hypothetical protein
MKEYIDITQGKFKAARDWWNGTLSMNEQRAFAKKHLLSYQASYITTDIQYVSRNYYFELIVEVWEKEGHTL